MSLGFDVHITHTQIWCWQVSHTHRRKVCAMVWWLSEDGGFDHVGTLEKKSWWWSKEAHCGMGTSTEQKPTVAEDCE